MKLLKQPVTRHKGLGRLLAAFVWMTLADAAQAAPCVVIVSKSTIDFGTHTASQGRAVQTFGKQTLNLSAHCSEASLMTLVFRGAPDAGTPSSFQFGSGSLVLRPIKVTLDEREVVLGKLGFDGIVLADSSVTITPDERVTLLWQGQPVKGRHLSLVLELAPLLPQQALQVRSAQSFRSDLSVELLAQP